MESIDKIKAHYNFTSDDVKNLVSLREVMDKRRGEFVEEFYEYVKNFDNASDFLDTDEVISKHQDAIGQWFLHIFNGEYSIAYFKELEMVGMAHVKINLNAHYVNAAMYFVKRYVDGVLAKEITDEKERGYIARSVDKMLEINLDVMTSSYIAEEKRKIFISQKLEGFMITVAKRFSHGLNIVLVLGLVALGVLAVGLFGYDVSHIFTGENLEESLLTTLGSLLMLWVVIELVDTEIKHLKGAKFAINVFISVALVAVIRKILVTSLSSEKVEAQLSLIAAVAVLGVVYWLIAKVEKQ